MYMGHKKTILHIIQNFGIGGAETAVVGVLKNLHEYNNIVVTLDGLNQFGDELNYDHYYNLNLKSYYLFPFAISKLRKIIRKHKVDLVHSQLYWSTVLARFATPKEIPLVTSIQSSLTGSVEYKKKWICNLERFSFNRRPSTILGVSKCTLDDYFDFLGLQKGETHVLYNFVDTSVFNDTGNSPLDSEGFKLITVGNLIPQKNQQFLLDAFVELKGKGISLDIYGDGYLQEPLQQCIDRHQLPVRLMGKIRNLPEVLPGYDLFVMSSLYEGFSLAVLEGMALQRPMLLSDIPTFREQCADTARYFSLNKPADFVQQTLQLKQDKEARDQMGAKGRHRVMQHFTLEHHLSALRQIYRGILKQ